MDNNTTTESENSKWVPREKYDMVVAKMDAFAMENDRLKAENERLKKMCSGDFSGDRLPIGCAHY